MAEEIKEKKELLKREEIRTMQKDLFKLREEEAKIEREKIIGWSAKEGTKTEKPTITSPAGPAQPPAPSGIPPQRISPPTLTRPVPGKPSPSEKIFIRVSLIVLVVLFLALCLTFWYWYSGEIKKISILPKKPTPTPTEEAFVPSPSPSITPEITPSPTTTFSVIDRILSVGYRIPSSPRLIDTIIIHSTYNTAGENAYDVEEVIKDFNKNKVASHYLMARDGTIYRLAPDKAIAYHAGTSEMPDGRTSVNNFSIGIELIYTKEESPDEIQYQALSYLVKNLQQQYNIPPENILGHKNVSLTKDDPWNFDWEKFNQLIK